MKSSNFNFSTLTEYRQFLKQNARTPTLGGTLVTALRSMKVEEVTVAENYERCPYVLVVNPITRGVEIHSTRHLRKVHSWSSIGLTHMDAILISHYRNVPILSPFSIGVEAGTMSIIFGVLLPMLEEEQIINEDPARIFGILLIACLIIYPLIYKLASLALTKKNPQQRSMIMYSYDDLIMEGFRLFTVLVCALIGLDLTNSPINKAALGTGVVAPLLAIFGKISSLTEWNSVIFLALLRDLLHTGATFIPLMYIVNSLPEWLPEENKSLWVSTVSPATVMVGLPAISHGVNFLMSLPQRLYTAFTTPLGYEPLPRGESHV